MCAVGERLRERPVIWSLLLVLAANLAVFWSLSAAAAEGSAPEQEPRWAPLTFTFGGFWEIQPHALEEHLNQVQVVDVREADEYAGPMGRIRGARLVPLGELRSRADELDRDRPVVTVCRAGARSAHAVTILQKAGFDQVANLAGGMLRWRAEGGPVEGGAE